MKGNNFTPFVFTIAALISLYCTSCKKEEQDPFIVAKQESVKFSKAAEAKNVEVSTNIADWTATVTGAEWCAVSKLSNNKVEIKLDRNALATGRTCNVTLSGGNTMKAVIVVTQTGLNDSYTPENASAIAADVKISVAGSTASESQAADQAVGKSHDGDMTTRYHSLWAGTNFPVTLEYSFSGVAKIDYMVYYPRSDGGVNGNFGKIEIWYKAGAAATFTKHGDFDLNGSTSPAKIVFSGGIASPQAIRVVIKSGTNNFACCAEMEFYAISNANATPSVFVDGLCAQLKPGTTLAQIDAIENAFFKNLAKAIFNDDYPLEFRLQQYKAYPNPSVAAQRNKTERYSLLDNPTGMSVKADEQVVVFVKNSNSQQLSLSVVDFEKGFGSKKDYVISEGINKIKVAQKGLLYIQYHTDGYATADPISVHIACGAINGYFDSSKHSTVDWSRLLAGATDIHFDVVGKYAHLIFPLQSFKTHTPNGGSLVEAYDELVRLEQDFMGLYKYGNVNRNRLLFHVIYDANEPGMYMYATSFRTAYNSSTMGAMCNVAKFKTSDVWGPAHEVGHINQTRPGLKWVGMTEVTNNIYSLYVQTSFGNSSRLLESAGTYSSRYAKAFATIIEAKIPFATSDDVFCKLVPFWQLYLYFTKAKGNIDFYKDVHQRVRSDANAASDGECQLNFVKICSDVAQTDLTDFFSAWGFLSPIDKEVSDYGSARLTCTQAQIDAVKEQIKQYPKPSKEIQYITDLNINQY